MQTIVEEELCSEQQRKAQLKKWRDENKQKIKEQNRAYYDKTKHLRKIRDAEYYQSNKAATNERTKHYYNNNASRCKQLTKRWYNTNRDAINEINRSPEKRIKRLNEHKQRCMQDEIYHAKHKLRVCVYSAFARIKMSKPAETLKLLGCTWQQAKEHIESLFQPGMSWKNHGEWHIDHIRPVASFAMEEMHFMNHYTNLQPLWAAENLSKGRKLV